MINDLLTIRAKDRNNETEQSTKEPVQSRLEMNHQQLAKSSALQIRTWTSSKGMGCMPAPSKLEAPKLSDSQGFTPCARTEQVTSYAIRGRDMGQTQISAMSVK